MTDPVSNINSSSAADRATVEHGASASPDAGPQSSAAGDRAWSPPHTPIDGLKQEPTQAERLAGDDAGAAANAAGAAAIAHQQGARIADQHQQTSANAQALEGNVRNEAAGRIGSQTASERGPVVTGVGDMVTGEVHHGKNFNMTRAAGRAEYAEFRENAHPVVNSRIDAREAALDQGTAVARPRDGTVGAHSEVVALDTAIKAREAVTGVPVKEADLGSFQLHNRSMMNAHPTAPMDRCTNCRAISAGTEVVGHDGAPSNTLRDMAADRPYSPLRAGDLPGARQGGAMGAAASGVVSTATALWDGKITTQEGVEIAQQTGVGAAIGAVSAKAEQAVTPAISRALAERSGVSASSILGTSAASRVLGSTAVGAVVSAGVSAYTNREGLANGDSQAIGNVTADTVVGAAAVAGGSIVGAAAAGALAGSVVPGLGTAVGFAVGVGVGVAITYGAQLGGVRDAIADGTAAAVDGAKSLASSAWSGLKGMFA